MKPIIKGFIFSAAIISHASAQELIAPITTMSDQELTSIEQSLRSTQVDVLRV